MAVIDTSAPRRAHHKADLRRGDLIIVCETLIFFGLLGLIESFGFLAMTDRDILTVVVVGLSVGLIAIGGYGRIRLSLNHPPR